TLRSWVDTVRRRLGLVLDGAGVVAFVWLGLSFTSFLLWLIADLAHSLPAWLSGAIVVNFLVIGMSILLAFYALIVAAGIAACAAALLGVALSPLPILFGAAMAAFGPDLSVAGLVLDVAAEPTPPGVWTVHQLSKPEPSGQTRDLGAPAWRLMHSAT